MNNFTPRNDISFLGALTILFVGLKLTNNIDWSWWLVVLPFFIDWGINFVFLVLLYITKYSLSKKLNANGKNN